MDSQPGVLVWLYDASQEDLKTEGSRRTPGINIILKCQSDKGSNVVQTVLSVPTPITDGEPEAERGSACLSCPAVWSVG